MPKVKTTYAHKIQSIVIQFPDEFMESINNQLYCNLCNCAVSCNKRFLVESFESLKKLVDSDQRNVRNKNMVSLM